MGTISLNFFLSYFEEILLQRTHMLGASAEGPLYHSLLHIPYWVNSLAKTVQDLSIISQLGVNFFKHHAKPWEVIGYCPDDHEIPLLSFLLDILVHLKYLILNFFPSIVNYSKHCIFKQEVLDLSISEWNAGSRPLSGNNLVWRLTMLVRRTFLQSYWALTFR